MSPGTKQGSIARPTNTTQQAALDVDMCWLNNQWDKRTRDKYREGVAGGGGGGGGGREEGRWGRGGAKPGSCGWKTSIRLWIMNTIQAPSDTNQYTLAYHLFSFRVHWKEREKKKKKKQDVDPPLFTASRYHRQAWSTGKQTIVRQTTVR